MKNIEDIIRDDQTPRTRNMVQKISVNGNKDIPIEYDDDSVSQSQISSADDVTVDKASPSPSANIDFLEDFWSFSYQWYVVYLLFLCVYVCVCH